MTTLTHSTDLVVTSCWCGIGVAIPRSLYNAAQENPKQGIYCPVGHTFVYGGPSAAERERQRREHAEARERALRDQLDASERSNRALKGVVTRTKRRAANGVCPVPECHRHFANVEAHVKRMHPGYVEVAEAIEEVAP